MKIALVTPYALDRPGGVQDQVVRLRRWLIDDGHDAWIVAPGSGGPDDTRHVGKWVQIPANGSIAPITLSPRAIARVKAATADAEVVHVHEPFMPVASLGALTTVDGPKVATFHADPGPITRRFYGWGAGFLRRSLSRAAVVTAVSPVAAAAVSHLADPVIVPNGIDVPDDVPGERAYASVVFVGRDDPRKGLDVLIQAWPLVKAAVPEATLDVVGADREAVPEGVRFHGRVAIERRDELIGGAAVLCAPNLGGESFGLVVAEGMAMGCAVVASDLAAFRNVGGDGVAYTEVGNPVSVAQVIIRLMGDDDERQRLAEAARERVVAFGRGAVLRKYVDAYRTAAG